MSGFKTWHQCQNCWLYINPDDEICACGVLNPAYTEKPMRKECRHCGSLPPQGEGCSCQIDDRSIVRAGSIPLGMPQAPKGGLIRWGSKTYKLVECVEGCDPGDCSCSVSRCCP